MFDFIQMIQQHPTIFALGAYWVFSALVGGMPAPTATSSAGYQWLHNSLHILAGNITAAIATKYPQITTPPPPGSVQVTTTQQKTVTATPPEPKE